MFHKLLLIVIILQSVVAQHPDGSSMETTLTLFNNAATPHCKMLCPRCNICVHGKCVYDTSKECVPICMMKPIMAPPPGCHYGDKLDDQGCPANNLICDGKKTF